MRHPRELITSELEKQKKEFLAAGRSIQKVPLGLSGINPEANPTGQRKLLRAQRAKLAPELRKHAEAGRTIQAAAQAMKLKSDRAQIIAKENGIVFGATEPTDR